MASVTQESWEQFYDRVVVGGRNWPRNLWFAAVEDGLRAALPAHSPLLAQYRQDVGELAEIERAGAASHHDTTRVQQLEAEIKRLIGIADQSIRESADQPPARSQPRIGFWLAALTLGIIMFCGALLGATYHLQQRATERMQLDIAALQQRLMEQAAGRQQMSFVTQAAIMGGHVRVGLEDSLYLGKGELAKSNAEQVAKIRRIVEELSLSVASPTEARAMLKLKGGDNVAF